MELKLSGPASPAKKAARKATKKAVKKAAKKAPKKAARKKAANSDGAETASSEQGASRSEASSEEQSDFRPTDFKGRGSHFDGVDVVDVAPDVPAKGSGEAPRDSSEAKAQERSAKQAGEADPQDRPAKSHQNQKNHQQRHGKQNNRHQGKKGPPHGKNRQKNKRGGPNGHGRMGGGWQQPMPPKETDLVGGILPASARYAKFENVEAIFAALDVDGEPIDLAELYEMNIDQGRVAAEGLGVVFDDKPGRKQILEEVFKLAGEQKRLFKDSGFLDLTDEGHGFVVHQGSNYQLKPESVYVPPSVINRYSLKRGMDLEILATPPQEGERCPAAIKILSAMGGETEAVAKVTAFEDLIPYYPTERLVLETPLPSNSKKDVSMRAFDILTPIGLGQRGLIVAPPRTGKTVLLQGLAYSVQENYPNAHLIVLLIDERPEEVTDFRRKVKGEVISSTFDETASSHVHAAEMVVEKARRMVEQGKDVVILLDSITRLARAYNALASNSGKIMSGGIEATALQKPKRFFGSARNIEEGGSLTIMGTALVDTGSKMDEVIFEEFKGTGNMEIHLDRDLINKRVFPAINFERSGTRKEELLYHPVELEKVYGLRRVMQGVPGVEAMEMLIKRLKATKSNAEFLMSLK